MNENERDSKYVKCVCVSMQFCWQYFHIIYDHFCCWAHTQRKHNVIEKYVVKTRNTNTHTHIHSFRHIDFRSCKIQHDLNLMKKKIFKINDIHTTRSWELFKESLSISLRMCVHLGCLCLLAQQEKPVFSNFQTACDQPRFFVVVGKTNYTNIQQQQHHHRHHHHSPEYQQ